MSNCILGDGCLPRHQTKKCNELSDRITCLTSFEERNLNFDTNKEIVHPGSECVWCPEKSCPFNHNIVDSNSQCESKSLITDMAGIFILDENGIEDCLKVPSKYTKLV